MIVDARTFCPGIFFLGLPQDSPLENTPFPALNALTVSR
jgi:hypothetical protein